MMSYESGFVNGSDGTRLFFQATGTGPDIIACNGIGVSTFFWKYIKQHFCRSYRFITWDYRGHGRSEPPRDRSHVSMSDQAADMACIADHLDAHHAILLGHSMGVQVILEYYRSSPDRVAALVPVLGSFGRPLDTFMNSSLSRPIFDRIVELSRRKPRLVAHLTRLTTNPTYAIPLAGLVGLFDRFYCPAEDLRQYLEHIASIDSQLLMEMALAMADHSAGDLLPRIQVPTLIIAGERDLFTPVHLSLEMQRRIPGAELLMLRQGSHAALIEQPELMIRRLEEFLARHSLTAATISPRDQLAVGAFA
jgi:pimeloyl-ACP methyl ester carboxylesterase